MPRAGPRREQCPRAQARLDRQPREPLLPRAVLGRGDRRADRGHGARGAVRGPRREAPRARAADHRGAHRAAGHGGRHRRLLPSGRRQDRGGHAALRDAERGACFVLARDRLSRLGTGGAVPAGTAPPVRRSRGPPRHARGSRITEPRAPGPVVCGTVAELSGESWTPQGVDATAGRACALRSARRDRRTDRQQDGEHERDQDHPDQRGDERVRDHGEEQAVEEPRATTAVGRSGARDRRACRGGRPRARTAASCTARSH